MTRSKRSKMSTLRRSVSSLKPNVRSMATMNSISCIESSATSVNSDTSTCSELKSGDVRIAFSLSRMASRSNTLGLFILVSPDDLEALRLGRATLDMRQHHALVLRKEEPPADVVGEHVVTRRD